jgi:hypothetical protein
MFSWGTFQRIFETKKFLKKKKKKWLLCAFVCPSWFKETGGLHSVRRSGAPLVNIIIEIITHILKLSI